MRILVTGGAGFIGAWIVRRLAQAGHTPVVFDMTQDRSKLVEIAGRDMAEDLDWIPGDISVTDDVVRAAKECGSIIHLAGLLTPACRADPLLGVRVNLIGTLNAFLAARTHGMSSISYMSSIGIFGPEGSSEPRPTTLYGAFKLGAEHSARAFHVEDGISSVAFRPYVVYGPGREGGLSAGPSLACRAAARGDAYEIPFTGDVDMIHVSDVATAFLAAIENPVTGAHAMNLLGTACTVDDVAATINGLAPGARITASGAPMPIACPTEDGAMTALFPGHTQRTMADGLKSTIEHYRKGYSQ